MVSWNGIAVTPSSRAKRVSIATTAGSSLNAAAGALGAVRHSGSPGVKSCRHAGSAAPGADMLRGGGRLRRNHATIAEMRDIDRDEEMRAVIRHAESP